MLVSFEQVYKSFNGVYLLENISVTLEEKDRVGIIGPNGAGKTTLLRLLQGKIDPDKGEIRKARNITVGVLDQIQPADPNNSISDEMMLAFAPLLAQQKEMLALEGSLSGLDPQSKEAEEALARYAMLQSDFETHDGHLMEVNMAKVLNGLGFPKERWQDPVSALSGGEKTRLALARLLLQAPDLLILDEPTNHLDFDTLHWLEGFLADYRGA
ncbi:MAG: ABC-F family ATP-binding cassette domain-containing protein, partial [Oscillospiraceae bacterium]|nr:ABC-F family ATP-binding cassette domain-containing protein [Oscillospiraceae bacterium]